MIPIFIWLPISIVFGLIGLYYLVNRKAELSHEEDAFADYQDLKNKITIADLSVQLKEMEHRADSWMEFYLSRRVEQSLLNKWYADLCKDIITKKDELSEYGLTGLS